MDIEMLRERARIIQQIRSFFNERNYLELDTPLLSPDLIPETCLEVFETCRILPNGDSHPLWLIPSPEIWMKKIIAKHRVSVYQICKCFRNGESTGFLHSPEFTMLEFYTVNAGYLDSLLLTEDLFKYLIPNFITQRRGGTKDNEELEVSNEKQKNTSNYIPPSAFSAPPRLCVNNSEKKHFEKITVGEAFARYAGFDLFAAAEKTGGLETEARRLGLDPPAGLGNAALYDLIFIHAVEPKLKQNQPIALLDYPAFVPCLAKQSTNGKTVERWELYWNGIELANCYSEETDPQRVREFFRREAAAKESQALVQHNIDHTYWKNFLSEPPFPACSGVAMGLDRLIMLVLGRSTIDSVLPFPLE